MSLYAAFKAGIFLKLVYYLTNFIFNLLNYELQINIFLIYCFLRHLYLFFFQSFQT